MTTTAAKGLQNTEELPKTETLILASEARWQQDLKLHIDTTHLLQ